MELKHLGKCCANCIRAIEKTETNEQSTREIITVDGVIVSERSEVRTSIPKVILSRGCSIGGDTVPVFDKCLSKREFVSREQSA